MIRSTLVVLLLTLEPQMSSCWKEKIKNFKTRLVLPN